MRWLVLLAAAAPLSFAQQVGSIRGDDFHGYNLVQSWETGYRFADIHGDRGKYRSDVNFRNGVRLLGSNLTVHSKDGQGRFFDTLVLTTQGLGNDPYESAVFRIEKNKLFRYDLLWRRNDYYNPALPISFGNHLIDTTHRWQDHDFVFLPQSKLQLKLGYTRNRQEGPALSTANIFGEHRNGEFPLFESIRRDRNEYRAGADVGLAGFKLSLMRVWDNFKEDSTFLGAGNPISGGLATLSGFRRDEPYHGNTPIWRANLRKQTQLYSANARFTYAGGRRRFTLDELALGTARFTGFNRQVIVTGDANRPVSSGDLSLSLYPTARLTLNHNTSFHSTRISGDSAYREITDGFRSDALFFFNYLGVRTIASATDAVFEISKMTSVSAGYLFSKRRIRSRETLAFEGDATGPSGATNEQSNTLNAGRFGLRMRPVKPFTISLDAELGRNDRPFTPVSERNYHALGGRAQYKARSFTAGAQYRANYNTNSVAITAHSSRTRSASADFSWTPRGFFAIDAAYLKLHADTASGLAYFGGGQLNRAVSIYVSNIHSANLAARFALTSRAELAIGYSLNKDTGDGRGSNTPPTGNFLYTVQTFPLRYQSPSARISVRLHQKIRWNAGWQFYDYGEDFGLPVPVGGATNQNYRAHTGYASLLWSF